MLEKKTVWVVKKNLETEAITAIVENNKVLACKKDTDEDFYGLFWYGYSKFFNTKEEAVKFIEERKKYISEMVPKVSEFIDMMDSYELRTKLKIDKKDYLGCYAEMSTCSYKEEYYNEQQYAEKLETFARSRMLNINGSLFPVENVKNIEWYGTEDADEFEEQYWRAEIKLSNGDIVDTGSENDVRLIWAVLGRNNGIYNIDNDIDYNKD